ncbi:MAG: tRNA (guanosine(37)-N1)-methyltransferase TrmD [Candidatus Dependentiae bacterium]|nr:tRNA (guanosine(37)-N1)-methyltransferase TrmD [Candidatus Dependentiae bacterium]
MNISILTVFPELYNSFLQTSLVGRAQEKKLVSLEATSFFSYVQPKERIDAPTFGHGSGMVIRPDVIEKAIADKEQQFGPAFKIFFSPQGKKLDQPMLRKLAQIIQERKHIMLIPARYEGMDARVEQTYADEILSIGDFVLLGGDLPAMVLIEGLIRLLPGVVGKQESIEKESFSGAFVDYPVYTAPVVWKDLEVPEVVRSGNHAAMEAWRMDQAVHKTVLTHFDWLRSQQLTSDQVKVAKQHMPNHYVVLMHGDVLIGEDKQLGTTSVTSIDIHDIARASKSYGVRQFFIVTPLLDQQRIVRTLLDFWQTGVGIDYNRHRHEAVNAVDIKDTIDGVIASIEAQEGVKPLLVATSARDHGVDKTISFFDQAKVWGHGRPVLFIFGTGKGLSEQLMSRCDYVLMPVHGFSNFNHLSVRSAVAVILDRWMGINVRIR